MRILWIGIVASLLCVSLMSCRKDERLPSLTISGVTYSFPQDHLLGLRGERDNGPFVYLRPPGRDFIIVYSQRVERLKSAKPDKFVIAYLTEGNELNYSVEKSGSQVVVCTPGELKFRCGFRLQDDGVGWSVLFDRNLKSDTARISQEAFQLLQGYRGL